MNSHQTGTLAGSDLSDDDVEHYLTTHPDFFERHPGLLSRMRVPHDGGGGSISLVERQLVDTDHLIADTKSGVSGAGRKAATGTLRIRGMTSSTGTRCRWRRKQPGRLCG